MVSAHNLYKKQQYLKKTIKTKKSDLSRFFGFFLKTIKNQNLKKPYFPPLLKIAFLS